MGGTAGTNDPSWTPSRTPGWSGPAAQQHAQTFGAYQPAAWNSGGQNPMQKALGGGYPYAKAAATSLAAAATRSRPRVGLARRRARAARATARRSTGCGSRRGSSDPVPADVRRALERLRRRWRADRGLVQQHEPRRRQVRIEQREPVRVQQRRAMATGHDGDGAYAPNQYAPTPALQRPPPPSAPWAPPGGAAPPQQPGNPAPGAPAPGAAPNPAGGAFDMARFNALLAKRSARRVPGHQRRPRRDRGDEVVPGPGQPEAARGEVRRRSRLRELEAAGIDLGRHHARANGTPEGMTMTMKGGQGQQGYGNRAPAMGQAMGNVYRPQQGQYGTSYGSAGAQQRFDPPRWGRQTGGADPGYSWGGEGGRGQPSRPPRASTRRRRTPAPARRTSPGILARRCSRKATSRATTPRPRTLAHLARRRCMARPRRLCNRTTRAGKRPRGCRNRCAPAARRSLAIR